MMDSVTVEQGSFEGKIWANEVRIGSESEVGDVVGGDNVYMENGAKAGFVYSPILRTGQGVKITQLATSVLTSSRGLRAGIVTIFDGGEASFPIGSRIEELRLGIGVKEPGWLTKIGIKKIVTGQSIPVPPEWEK